MTNEETFSRSSSIRAPRNLAIVALVASGAVFASTEVLAGIGGQEQVCEQTAWETGVDGAKPGIILPAVFTVGDVYRQEWLLGDAEDVAENLSMTELTPAASCTEDCLKTHEYSPLEPDTSESKFYAPDVGVIVTLDDNDPSFREELVEFAAP
jgi:hypothetical protein